MNVYDFDNTIYSGESAFDFFKYCLVRDFRNIKFFFPVLITLIKYKMCKISIEKMHKTCEKYIHDFVIGIENPQKTISEFWDKNQHKIKKFYLEQKKEDDIILSASCDILLEEICNRLGINSLIATVVDRDTFEISRMCFRENKVEIFNELFPNAVVDEFYTDSKNDIPMARRAKKAFYVKGDTITEWRV